jgi:hypothetical protein
VATVDIHTFRTLVVTWDATPDFRILCGNEKEVFMRRFILWIAAILITFAIGVGADRLWWYFLAAPPAPVAEPVAVNSFEPQTEVVPAYVPPPPPPAAPPPPKPTMILDYDPLSLSLYAAFYPMGPLPKEFADFDSFEAMLSPDSVEDPGTIAVYTRQGAQSYKAEATFGLVSERRLFFATSKSEKGDFEYRFDGEFVRTDFDAVAGKNKAVLRGTLIRMKNGRTITQHEFTFRMEYMGC